MRQAKSLSLQLSHMFFITFFSFISAFGQSVPEIAKKAFNSTVLLVMEDSNGHPLSFGSGFFVNNGEIATNLHVIDGAAKGYVKIVGKQVTYNILGITAIDSERDLIILKIQQSGHPMLSLGNSDNIQVGESVYVVGNPYGLEGTFSQGIISGIRNAGRSQVLQITAPISPGSSGGPVLNNKGEVIGVSVATYKSGQNLNFAIPSRYLKNLLTKSSAPKPLPQTAETKTQRSILANFGNSNTEGIIVSHFLWDNSLGEFSVSIKNQLSEPVKNVRILIIFFDSLENPLDISEIRCFEIIPPGLAKRDSGRTHDSIFRLTTPPNRSKPYTKLVFRILDFDLVK